MDYMENKKQDTASALKDIISHAKEYGFVFPSSEIYDGLQAVYDYGQNGVELKNNLKTVWYKAMTMLNDNVVGIDASIFMHPLTWKASGHVDSFNDPMIDNKVSKKRYRADTLLEERAAALEDEGKADEAKALMQAMAKGLDAGDLEAVRQLIIDQQIKCPVSGTANWTEVRQFNLMFSTQVGAVSEDASLIYLRPETAQGIFVNFLNVQKTGRMKIPFGIAQIGKAFRNEIVARNFIFRMREFEQMEMQFFVRPGTQKQWYEYWKETRIKWHKKLGLGDNNYRFHNHVKMAHYADDAVDIEFNYPFGFKELEGIHSRTDFDLKNHQELSGKKMQYFDAELDENGKAYGNYIPYVVETSVGLDRLFLSVLCASYKEEEVGEGDKIDTRVVLSLPAILAPYKVAIFPLTKKDGLPEVARKIIDELKFDYNCFYEEKDAIGKRYRRQDALGTPFCITVDHESLENQTVTIRYRDTMVQERIPIAKIREILASEVNWSKLLA
jgi:glycyl-tRNA synthetase